MNKLIEAADRLRDLVQEQFENGCEICHGDCGSANPTVARCPVRRRHTALTAYRSARESAGEVKVKPLVWECEAGWRWKGMPPDGFFPSVAKWVWSDMNGKFKHLGSKDLFSTVEEAKAAAQADYETRIRGALAE